jgi:hypothetical protein
MYFGSISQNPSVLAQNNFSMYQSSFKYLSLYESSFSFFNKRIYQFSGLNNNLFNTTNKLNINLLDLSTDFDLSVDSLGLNTDLINNTYAGNNLTPYNYLFNDSVVIGNVLRNNYIKDVLPLFGENDLLSNDLLRTTFNITQSFNKPSQVFSFYDPHFFTNHNQVIEDLVLDFEVDNDGVEDLVVTLPTELSKE